MLPLSFKEYISTFGSTDLERKYADYLLYSSFPYTIKLDKDIEKVRDYLGGIYNTDNI